MLLIVSSMQIIHSIVSSVCCLHKSLFTFPIISNLSFNLFFLSVSCGIFSHQLFLPLTPSVSLQYCLSCHLFTIFLSLYFYSRLHSPHTKYCTIYSFPFLFEESPFFSLEHYGRLLCFIGFSAVRQYEVILNLPRAPLYFFLWVCDITLCLYRNIVYLSGLYPELWKTGFDWLKWPHQLA